MRFKAGLLVRSKHKHKYKVVHTCDEHAHKVAGAVN